MICLKLSLHAQPLYSEWPWVFFFTNKEDNMVCSAIYIAFSKKNWAKENEVTSL